MTTLVNTIESKSIIRPALITAGILLIPVWGNLYVDGWNWSDFDFVFAGIVLFGLSFLFELARKKAGNSTAYKMGAGLALLTIFFLLWINGAVGIIGDGDNVSVIYMLVPLTLIVGSAIARFKSRGLSLVLFAAAFVQFMIPIVAYFGITSDFAPGVAKVFMLNSIFVLGFLASGFFFRQASISNSK
jgi:hypothetical protein